MNVLDLLFNELSHLMGLDLPSAGPPAVIPRNWHQQQTYTDESGYTWLWIADHWQIQNGSVSYYKDGERIERPWVMLVDYRRTAKRT